MIIPVNHKKGETHHWFVISVNFTKKIIEVYDSSPDYDGRQDYVNHIFRYLGDEHQAYTGSPFPYYGWEKSLCYPRDNEGPIQSRIGNNCGVFTCLFMEFLIMDIDPTKLKGYQNLIDKKGRVALMHSLFTNTPIFGCWRNFPQVQYHQMKAIKPPSKGKVLELLREFDMYLQNNSALVKKKFDMSGRQEETAGIRKINGDRYEVFVNDLVGKGTGIFDWLMEEVQKQRKKTGIVLKEELEQLRRDIIVFANKRAQEDNRVSKDTIFQNHALIITFGKCQRQDIHIDLAEKKHFQFGLLCTDNVFGTQEYIPQEPVIGEDCNLGDIWNDIPPSLARNLLKHDSTKMLLKDFGSVLSVSENTGTDTRFPIGTLISLPGNVPHAGPVSDKVRAVMFFTGNPPDETPYYYDTQHTRTTLLSEIMMHNWVPLQDHDPDYVVHREYLLSKWDLLGLQNDRFAVNNMHHAHLIQFAKDISKSNGDQEKKRCVIKALAERKFTQGAWEGNLGSLT